MKINVLGTEYTIDFITEKDETMKVMDCVGYTDFSVKKIKVFKDKYDATKCEDLTVSENTTLRHELIHAFLYECGIESGMQFHDEVCVDFFALQIPKLMNIFKKAGCNE